MDRGKLINEKQQRSLGGTWTFALRPCDGCGAEHHHLTDLVDGRHVCISCWMDGR